MPRSSKYDQLRSKPPVALALVATFASATALTVLYNHARNPELSFALIEQQASQGLAHIGYGWARVSIENGIATIGGEAPGESERVIAYDMVRRSLRPYMGKAHIIDGVSSHLQLSQPAAAALAQANTGRDARGSDYYLSADANLPYPAPRVVSSNTESSSEKVTMAALEPTSGQEAVVLEDANGTADSATPETSQAVTSVLKDEAGAWITSAQIETSAKRTVTIDASDEPDASAVAIGQPGSITRNDASDGSLSSHSPSGPAHAVTTAKTEAASSSTARIETAAVNTPEPAKTGAQTAVSTGAKTSLNAATGCKAEFTDVLSQSAIEFAPNSAVIEKKSRPLLDTLTQIAKRCSRFRLVVEGHTDLSGGKTHNQTLSQKRADAVRWALIDRGVDMDHITAQGYGSSRPLERGTSEAANARNRRIEFSVQEPQPHGRNAASAR